MSLKNLTTCFAITVCLCIVSSANAQLNTPLSHFPGDADGDGTVTVLGDYFTANSNFGIPGATEAMGNFIGNDDVVDNYDLIVMSYLIGTTGVGPGDVDGNGTVDVLSDAFYIVTNMNKQVSDPTILTAPGATPVTMGYRSGDLNSDGVVNFWDWFNYVANQGKTYDYS